MVLRDRMVDALIKADDLHDPRWIDAFRAVPRHAFIPDRATTDGHVIDRGADPDGWMAACYAVDQAIVTQTDDGNPDGPGIASSSASAPSVVAEMLEALDVADGARVLEIGTGTGYNAALLCHRLGSGNVTTVEIDPAVADDARRALHATGYAPTVAVGDGAAGHPPGAPYDRVIATCAVRDIPHAWYAQTRPGGVIVTPWSPGPGAGALLTLCAADDGTVTGRCGGDLAFMELRAQRAPVTRPPDLGQQAEHVTETRIDPWSVLFGDAAFAIRVRMPGVRFGAGPDHMWAGRDHDGAWIRIPLDDSGVRRAEIGGPASLWDELEGVWSWWIDHERPTADRFGLTIDGRSQWVWLDDPATALCPWP